MEPNEIIRLNCEKEKEEWHDACVALWIDAFGDREQFVKNYMDGTWKRNQVLLLPWCEMDDSPGIVSCGLETSREENSIASMLHMNPYPLSIKGEIVNVHYIVGVCTREEIRGRGYMDTLLKDALHILKEQGEPFTYLMPADKEIYRSYQFVPVGFIEKKIYSVFRKKEETMTADVSLIPFGNLSLKDRHKVLRLANGCRGDVYVPVSEEYIKDIEAQVHSYDGELITVWQNEKAIGMVAYLYEEEEIPIEVIQMSVADGYGELIKDVFPKYICEQFQTEEIRIQYDDMYTMPKSDRSGTMELHAAQTPQKHCTTMIRCLDPDWFLRRLSPQPDWGCNCTVEVRDGILTENNRVYRVIFGKDGQRNQVIPCGGQPDHCLNVETLVECVLSGLTVYTPELV